MGAARLFAIIVRCRLPLAAMLVLGGCAADLGPSETELKARWDAQNIYPGDYKADLLAFLRTYLNDPSHVRDAGVSSPRLKSVSSGRGSRYVACVRFNARDSEGKYQGPKEGAAIYASGKLERFLDRPRDVQDSCKGVSYLPFPELQKLMR